MNLQFLNINFILIRFFPLCSVMISISPFDVKTFRWTEPIIERLELFPLITTRLTVITTSFLLELL